MSASQPFFLALIIMSALFGMSCSDNGVSPDPPVGYLSGSGVLVTEDRSVPTFQKIHAQGPVTVVVRKGPSPSVRVTADHNVIQKVKTLVRGNGLHLELEDGEYHNIWIRIEVSVPGVSELTNRGTGTMKATGMTSVEPLQVVNSGSGELILEGEGPSLTLINEGAGTVKAFGYRAERVFIDNRGAGNCEITCTLLLEGSNVGGGSILYQGGATVTAENKGAGSILSYSGQE